MKLCTINENVPYVTVERELEFGNFKFYSGAGGEKGEKQQQQQQQNLGGCPVREVFLYSLGRGCPHWPSIQIRNARLQKFSHAMMRQLLLHSTYLVILLPKYFISFFSKQKQAHNFQSKISKTAKSRDRLFNFHFQGRVPL